MTIANLKRRLTRAGIDWRKWVNKITKTPETLLTELRTKVSKLVKRGGKEIRLVTSVIIDVEYPLTDLTTLRLDEKGRKYQGGLFHQRETRHTVSGKIIEGEEIRQSARRCLQEKLGYRKRYAFLAKLPGESAISAARRCIAENPKLSSRCLLFYVETTEYRDRKEYPYPGLDSFRKHHYFVCVIPKSLFNLRGCKRTFEGKTTIYEWMPMSVSIQNHI